MIYAKKGHLRTYFSDMIWKNMGSRKADWVQITKEEYDSPTEAPAAKGAEEVRVTKSFKELVDRAKGMVADGHLASGLDLYLQAQKVKDNAIIQKTIAKLEKQIEAQRIIDEQYNEIVSSADQAFNAGDKETALEFYKAAYEIKQDVKVKDQIDALS